MLPRRLVADVEDLDPERLRELLDSVSKEPAIIAGADQQQARLHAHRDLCIWWASLVLLARERKNRLAHLIAMQQLTLNLAQLEYDDLVYLATYLLCNTVSLVSAYEYDDDIPATVSAIVKPENMLALEKFIASDGQSCPVCGHDDGTAEHKCKGDPDEPQ